jgi:hypothetical protein
MATSVLLTSTVLYGSSWTGTAPGPGNPTVSGTIASSTDFSDHLAAADAGIAVAEVDFTNFGSGGFSEFKPGLINISWSLDLFQDFAAASIDAVFGAAVLARTLVYLDLKPTSAARSATNPSIVGAVYVKSYPTAYAVGAGVKTKIDFMSAGKFARLIA